MKGNSHNLITIIQSEHQLITETHISQM